MDGHRSAPFTGGLREGLGHLDRSHTGFQVQLQHVRHFFREPLSQNQEGRSDAGVAEFLGFSEREDSEGIGVMIERHPGGWYGTQSIGVVLGHKHQRDRGRDFFAEDFPVACELFEVHLDPGGTGAGNGCLHALPGGHSDCPTSVR